MLKCIRKVGNIEIFKKMEEDRPPTETDDELLIKLINLPADQEAALPVLLLTLAATSTLINAVALGRGFIPGPGADPGAVYSLLFGTITMILLLSFGPWLGKYPEVLAQIEERWLVISSQQLEIVEKSHYRIFASFGFRTRTEKLNWADIKRLALNYEYSYSTIGQMPGSARINPGVLLWHLLIFDDSKPPRPYRRSSPAFNVTPIRLGDLAYESAEELLNIFTRCLPQSSELLPLPSLKKNG